MVPGFMNEIAIASQPLNFVIGQEDRGEMNSAEGKKFRKQLVEHLEVVRPAADKYVVTLSRHRFAFYVNEYN